MGGMFNTCASKVEWWNYFELTWINMLNVIIDNFGGGGGEWGKVGFINSKKTKVEGENIFNWFEKKK